jgi:hypothetical protein
VTVLAANPRTDQTDLDGRRIILRNASNQLVKAEVEEMTKRARLERVIRQAHHVGVPIDEISDATGLRPSEIERILVKDDPDFELDELLGLS